MPHKPTTGKANHDLPPVKRSKYKPHEQELLLKHFRKPDLPDVISDIDTVLYLICCTADTLDNKELRALARLISLRQTLRSI